MQVGKDLSLLSGVTEEQIRTSIDSFISNFDNTNIYRAYDKLSIDEIDSIFKSIEKLKETSKGKNGIDDCLNDDSLRLSTEQKATKVVRKTILDEKKSEKSLEETEQSK